MGRGFDTSQNFWQLTCIFGAFLGLPGFLVGTALAHQYDTNIALCSIVIGNLILWGLAYGIISMSAVKRENAVENVKKYVGLWPGIISSLILTIGFLSWVLLNTHYFKSAIQSYTKWDTYIVTIIAGCFLGITALISYGNIFILKKICFFSFPFLFLYAFIQSIFSFGHFLETTDWSWDISFWPVVVIMLQNLGYIVSLPTLFRHSRSKIDSFMALTLVLLIWIFFQIFGVIIGISNPQVFPRLLPPTDLPIPDLLPANAQFFGYILPLVFIILLTLTANLGCIYIATAGWEAISNILRSTTESLRSSFKSKLHYVLIPQKGAKYTRAMGILCLINGLAVTVFYWVFQSREKIVLMDSLADNVLSTLAFVLLISFLTTIIGRHKMEFLKLPINGFSWFIGSLSAIYVEITTKNAYLAFGIGIAASFIVYLFALFIEVTYLSATSLLKRKNDV